MIHTAPLTFYSRKEPTYIHSPILSSRCVADTTSLFNVYRLFVVQQTDSRDWGAAGTRNCPENVAIFLSDRFPKTLVMEAQRATFTVLFTGCRGELKFLNFKGVILHDLKAKSLFSWLTSSQCRHQRNF